MSPQQGLSNRDIKVLIPESTPTIPVHSDPGMLSAADTFRLGAGTRIDKAPKVYH